MTRAPSALGVLHERVARSVAERGTATALVLGSRRLSYAELDALSDRIANVLRETGCTGGDRVCLLLPKEPEAIAAMLGALKAGCPYVPVDTASPAVRTARIVAAAEPRVVLVAPSAAALLDGVVAEGALETDVAIGTLAHEPVDGDRFTTSFTGLDIATADGSATATSVGPDDIAHILFTSGSTGEPKGVPITHRNVVTFLDWALSMFGIGPDDRLSSHPPLHFDLSTFDVFGALSCGAELHLVEPKLNLSAKGLGRFIEDAGLTQWFSVPSTMSFLASFDAVPDNGWPMLRRVLFCGEVMPTPVLAHWMRRLPHAAFTNLYGPTEATIASSFHTVPAVPADETVPVPIGRACEGEELVVLDEHLTPVATGEIGDLYIGGDGLSPGYWRDEEKTRAVFVADPRDPDRRLYKTGDLARIDDEGVIHFLGRADSQIKSRGYRIELGEIEAALNAIDAVREAAVVGVPSGGFEGTLIGCAYAADDADVTAQMLRARLSGILPPYMLPSRWLMLDALPKNANGKIDRVALRQRLAEELSSEGKPR